MKDTNEVWIVIEEGKPLNMAIVCELGKQQAKEIRKEIQQRRGGVWKTQKVTQKDLAAA